MDVIAERSLVLRVDGRDIPVIVKLGKPQPDNRYNSWMCTCEVGVGDSIRSQATHGADSLQAIQLALASLDDFLKRVVEKHGGELLHEDEPFISLLEASGLAAASK